MTLEQNITAILETYFSGFRGELIEECAKRIMEQIERQADTPQTDQPKMTEEEIDTMLAGVIVSGQMDCGWKEEIWQMAIEKLTTQTETQNSNLTFEKDECAKEYEELGLKELKELIKADRKTENSSEKPNNCEYAENPSGDVWECGCFLDTYCEHQIYDRNPDGTINIVECGYEPKTEPQTNKDFEVTYTCSFTDCDNFKNFGFGEKCIECKRKQSEAKYKTEPQYDIDKGTIKCDNCSENGSYKCSKCDGEIYFKRLEVEDEPQTCDTCKWGEWYRNGRDITNMDDECGGCCSWNSKWTPKTEQTEETEMERLERIDNEIEDAWARIRELTDEPQTDCPWK